MATSIPASRVIPSVEELIENHGKPLASRCDNGADLTSFVFTEWRPARGIAIFFI